jgi:hypothetical protein
MDLEPFTAGMTSLLIGAVYGISASSHHKVSDDADTFTFSPVIGYLFAAVGTLTCISPWLARSRAGIPPSHWFWYCSPIWLFIFAVGLFFFRYRVAVRDQTLTFGAFRRRVIQFSEIIDFDVILPGQRGAELWLYQSNGKRLKFSGYLGDFDELVGMVNSHMAGLPGPKHDSVAKIRDQERRKRGNRAANRLAVFGVLIVAAFVFILWRMQLLH